MINEKITFLSLLLIGVVVVTALFLVSGKEVNSAQKPIIPIIITLKGTSLNDVKRDFISKHNPFGVLLFCNNIKTKDGAKNLIAEIKKILKEVHGRDDKNIFGMVDQEGDRLNRLKWMDPKGKKIVEFNRKLEDAKLSSSI